MYLIILNVYHCKFYKCMMLLSKLMDMFFSINKDVLILLNEIMLQRFIGPLNASFTLHSKLKHFSFPLQICFIWIVMRFTITIYTLPSGAYSFRECNFTLCVNSTLISNWKQKLNFNYKIYLFIYNSNL